MFENGQRIAIKVCGLTSASDALMCADLGVEMLGLNFSPLSLRCISFAVAEEIAEAVRARVKLVGIFVNQPRELVEQTARDLSLDAVQLHGDETTGYMKDLQVPFLIKAVRVRESEPSLPKADAILLDAWNARSRGGTGEAFDWSIAAALRPRIGRLFLAGGLKAENVADAIRQVRPDAVDVCSGVEKRPGEKDPAKVRRLIAACR